MDYEKKYKKALEKAREECKYPVVRPFIGILEEIFPELTNSDIDAFDAELNALLKKYEHLSADKLAESLEFYLGVVRDNKPNRNVRQ